MSATDSTIVSACFSFYSYRGPKYFPMMPMILALMLIKARIVAYWLALFAYTISVCSQFTVRFLLSLSSTFIAWLVFVPLAGCYVVSAACNGPTSTCLRCALRFMALCRQLRFASQPDVKQVRCRNISLLPILIEAVETKQDIKSMTSRERNRVSKVSTPTLTVTR